MKSNSIKIVIFASISILILISIISVFHGFNIGNATALFSIGVPDKKVKILIVPGHEPNAGGADEFKTIKERNLNLQLSENIKDDLLENTDYQVVLARNENGWNLDLQNYVTKNSNKIMSWVADMKNKLFAKVDKGTFKIIKLGMEHNDAATSAVLYLYGTNKWIASNNFDLVLHVHFNNNPKINGRPNYRGYCMYVPDSQYGNASSSKILADYLNKEISKIEKPSNMPQEKDTIIPDQQLIATGVYDTLKIPSVVVEYAYIYEPMMLSSSTRNLFIQKAASSTATAISNYIVNFLKK